MGWLLILFLAIILSEQYPHVPTFWVAVIAMIFYLWGYSNGESSKDSEWRSWYYKNKENND